MADVTVTVAGPHSPPAADEPPTGEFPTPLDSTGELPLPLETGWGITVTMEVMTGIEEAGAEPVGATVVELPWP